MSMILFRRYAFEDERKLWTKSSPQTQQVLKNQLLQNLTEEQDRSVRQKITHAISTNAKFLDGEPHVLPVSLPRKIILIFFFFLLFFI